ncbi:MAG: heavy-metal-associated domain-containing protein [Clostridia bacterium]|nr:heavy-metal-associated domain-containing protein [Clostridia bacterium]
MKKLIKIDGMMCAHCQTRVYDALFGLLGGTVTVDLQNNTALVENDSAVSEDKIKDEIEAIGFDVISVTDL